MEPSEAARPHRLKSFWLLPALIVLLASCSSGARALKPPPGAGDMTPAEIVAALADPARAEEGVWGLLANLGMGVRRPDGAPVAEGSERRPTDAWLYDFEVPLLAKLAGERARPFSSFHTFVKRTGLREPEARLLAAFRSAYEKDGFLPQLLREMEVTFDRPPTLTPLQEWLLFLDAFVPPNAPRNAAPAGGGTGEQAAAADCPGIFNGEAVSGWGFVFGASSYPEVLTAEQAFRNLNSMLLVAAVRAAFRAEPISVHEGHEGPGGELVFDLQVNLDFVPTSVPVTCGSLVGVSGFYGPLKDVKVKLRVPADMQEHGEFSGTDATTNASGQASFTFTAREEPSKGRGKAKDLDAFVVARLDIVPALRAVIDDESFLQMIGPIELTRGVGIDWHDETETWVGTIRADHSVPQAGCSWVWQGELTVIVQPDGSASGGGTARPTGGGSGCQAGSGEITLSGNVVKETWTLSSPSFLFGRGTLSESGDLATGTGSYSDAYNFVSSRIELRCTDCGN